MKMRVFIAAIGAALSISTIGGEDYAFIESLDCVGGPFSLVLPTDARQLTTLGTLLREQILEIEEWDGYTATRKTLFFDGLALGVVEFSHEPSHVMVTHAEFSTPAWSHLMPFKIGQPTGAARALLGPRADSDADLRRTYGSEGDSVTFQSAQGVVVRVSYSCYSG